MPKSKENIVLNVQNRFSHPILWEVYLPLEDLKSFPFSLYIKHSGYKVILTQKKN